MRRILAVTIFSSLLVGGACSRAVKDTDVGDEITSLGAARSGSAVYVLDSGHWGRYVYHGATSESFWVDLSVRNDARSKDVGIIWTADRWRTSQRATAYFKENLPDGREKWGVESATPRWAGTCSTSS